MDITIQMSMYKLKSKSKTITHATNYSRELKSVFEKAL